MDKATGLAAPAGPVDEIEFMAVLRVGDHQTHSNLVGAGQRRERLERWRHRQPSPMAQPPSHPLGPDLGMRPGLPPPARRLQGFALRLGSDLRMSGTFVYISDQNQGETGTLTSAIYVNNVKVFTASASRAYSICTASGAVGR